MKQDWLKTCRFMSLQPALFYSGARKILRTQTVTFDHVKADLKLADAGYQKMKLSMLTKAYLNQESHDAAKDLWARRLEQGKYGSVGFSTYNHLIKGHGLRSFFAEVHAKKREGSDYKIGRASVMGPCIQALTLTLMPNGKTSIDAFYRTTELYKKFPADLIFIRDVLLDGFDCDIESLNFHFANVTCHPMYAVTILPHFGDPIRELEKIRRADDYFWQWIIRWTSRYLVPEHFHGIEKFGQAMRVRKDAVARIQGDRLDELVKYLRKSHRGYRRSKIHEEPEDDE